MAKRKRQSRKKKNSNSFLMFFVIVIIIAILAFVISYLVMQTENEAVADSNVKLEQTSDKKKPANAANVKVNLDGTWASYNDGAMLTISGRNYTIELPNVEGTIIEKGSVVIVENQITFVNTSEDTDCTIKPGRYSFVLEGKVEITFKKIDDDCASRKERIVATWFRV